MQAHPIAAQLAQPAPGDAPPIRFPSAEHDPAETALVAVGRYLQQVDYRFTVVSPDTHGLVNARHGSASADDLRGIFGWNRPFLPGLLPDQLLEALDRADALDTLGGGLLRSRVRFSTIGGQIILHSCFPTADPHAVSFGPDSYRFIQLLRRTLGGGGSLLEIGCGTGAAALSISDRFARVDMTDPHPLAVQYAQINAALADCHHVDILCTDEVEGLAGPYQAIVAQPRYQADASGPWFRDGKALGIHRALRIVDQALPLLAPGGCFVLATAAPIIAGRDLIAEELGRLLSTRGLPAFYEEIDVDLVGTAWVEGRGDGVERIALVALVVGQPGTAEPAHPTMPVWDPGLSVARSGDGSGDL